MLNYIFSKRTAIRYGVSLALFASLGSNATEYLAGRAPDGSGVKSLAIYSYDANNQNTIYANGKMQAPVDIVYELAEGYSVKNVTLKHLYTEEPLNDWFVSDEYNGYLPSVSGGQTYVASKNTLHKYISTNSARRAAICVELTASKVGAADSMRSTCSGESQSSNVYIIALSPQYLTKNNVELTDWDDSTEINKYVSSGDGVWSSEIKEQALKLINSYPKIRSFEVDNQLTSTENGLLMSKDSFLSQYYVSNQRTDVGHILSWVAHPNKAKKIRFIENVGFNQFYGWLLERDIPYYSSSDPHYILSLVTYKLRDDKFLYQGPYNCHYLCAEESHNSQRNCQYYNARLNETAPKGGFRNGDIERWKVERPKGIIKLIDDYGTMSQLTLGIRSRSNTSKDYEVFIE